MELFVFGNGNLSFERFVQLYVPPLEALNFEATADPAVGVLVCDFRGADTLVMEYLKQRTARVTVLHVGKAPRYLPDRYKTRVHAWTLQGGYTSDAERDQAAIEQCTHFLGFDFNTNDKRVSGTQRNIDRCLTLGKVRLGEHALAQRPGAPGGAS